jgi:signal transduction histidine kinase
MKVDAVPGNGSTGVPPERLGAAASIGGASVVRSRLFVKYVALFVAVVLLALLANGAFEIWFSYQGQKASLITLQRQQAQAAAGKIEQFIGEIKSQVGWTTQLPVSDGTLEQRRFDALRLLRQVPAITELAQVDAGGHEQLRVSRLTMDVVGSGIDDSSKPEFSDAIVYKVYYGPVYFRRDSEPYMTLSLAGTRRDAGVSIAQVNLKLIWDVVLQIKVGEHGYAYVVDDKGRLIAHPDISLVLRNTDMSGLAQVRRAHLGGDENSAGQVEEAKNIAGHKVLTAYAPVDPLGWTVLVETPIEEAYAPLHASIERTGFVLFGALALAFVAGMLLARRMVVPIQALRAGAAHIGGGDLSQRINIKTGDEVEALADQFNDMASRLQESYANLEKKVEERTQELSEALQQQTATSEVLGAISSSPGELEPVFQAMLENATRICDAKYGYLFLFDGGDMRVAATHHVPGDHPEIGLDRPELRLDRSICGPSVRTKKVFCVIDMAAESRYADSALAKIGGARTAVAVPMLRDDTPIGAITIFRREVRPFTDKQIELLKNFAAQAVIAIENTRLLDELRQRTDELARSVEELRALGEVSQAVNSTLELQTVLDTIVSKAVQLSQTEAGAIYGFDELQRELRLRATYGMNRQMIDALSQRHIGIDDPNIAPAIVQREPAQIADLQDEDSTPLNEVILHAGFRALLVAPLIHGEEIAGVLVVRRKTPGAFAQNVVELMKTFAAQSALAIQNARLFNEIADKGRQLEIASKHKSQFLANMSHELRTPLNAILGYTELILDNIYGEAPQRIRAVLERVQSNGKHLLGLINDVLDLSKIEAGQLTLSLHDYSIEEMVHGVHMAVEQLANGKKLAFTIDVPGNLPVAHGDERRLAQVLLNLVGNAIKFTDAGEVTVTAAAADGAYTIAVRDTGPGIALEDQAKIFEEFQQADNSQTKTKGGTGLGLSIAKCIVEMHGGRLWVESSPGHGSTFSFTVPLRVQRQAGQP